MAAQRVVLCTRAVIISFYIYPGLLKQTSTRVIADDHLAGRRLAVKRARSSIGAKLSLSSEADVNQRCQRRSLLSVSGGDTSRVLVYSHPGLQCCILPTPRPPDLPEEVNCPPDSLRKAEFDGMGYRVSKGITNAAVGFGANCAS